MINIKLPYLNFLLISLSDKFKRHEPGHQFFWDLFLVYNKFNLVLTYAILKLKIGLQVTNFVVVYIMWKTMDSLFIFAWLLFSFKIIKNSNEKDEEDFNVDANDIICISALHTNNFSRYNRMRLVNYQFNFVLINQNYQWCTA